MHNYCSECNQLHNYAQTAVNTFSKYTIVFWLIASAGLYKEDNRAGWGPERDIR